MTKYHKLLCCFNCYIGDFMEEIKHKHHYVFRAYLKRWAKNKKISCYRIKDKKIFDASLERIANQRDFYKIREINDDERKILFSLPSTSAERKSFEIIFAAYQGPIYMLKKAEAFKNTIECKFPNPTSELEKAINELINLAKVGTNNMIEDMYSETENKAIKLIREIISGNLNFYYNNSPQTVIADANGMDSKMEFIYFVCAQYFRTKNMRQRFISDMTKIPDLVFEEKGIKKENIDFENIVHLWFEVLSSRLADNLYKRQARLIVLKNNTQVPFITSDQPVINIKEDYKSQEDVEELVFYYPLSPTVAILLNDDNESKEMELTEYEVDFYNRKMISASREQIFSNDSQSFFRFL